MKKFLVILLSTLIASPVWAAKEWDFKKKGAGTSGEIEGTTDEINMVGGYKEGGLDLLSNSIDGNSATATALAANGANCGSGNSPLGVDASGAVEGCFDVGTQSEVDAKADLAGAKFTGNIEVSSSTLVINGSGSSLQATGLVSCDTIDTDADGVMSCGSDSGATDGAIIQSTMTVTDAKLSTTSTMLDDGSTPQNTEGLEAATVTITPTESSSKIRVTLSFHLGVNGANGVALALFVDSVATALDATYNHLDNNKDIEKMTIVYEEPAVSTTVRTYKARFAKVDGGTTAFLNRSLTTADPFGTGIITSSIKAEEIKQ